MPTSNRIAGGHGKLKIVKRVVANTGPSTKTSNKPYPYISSVKSYKKRVTK